MTLPACAAAAAVQDYEAVLKMVNGHPAALHGWQRVRNSMLGDKSINYNSRVNAGQTPAGPSHSSSSSSGSSSRNRSRAYLAVEEIDSKFRNMYQQPDISRMLQQSPTADLLLQNAHSIEGFIQTLKDYFVVVKEHPQGVYACGDSSIAALAAVMAWCQRLLPLWGLGVTPSGAAAADKKEAYLQLLGMLNFGASVLLEVLLAETPGSAFDVSFPRVQAAATVLESAGGLKRFLLWSLGL
jgi:hypothetical protein